MFERCVSSNEYPQWGFPIPSPILKLIPRTLRDEVPPHLSDYESADRSASPVLELVPGPHSSVARVHRQSGDSLDQMFSTTFDPENRLVADELERRWNQALERVRAIEVRIHEHA